MKDLVASLGKLSQYTPSHSFRQEAKRRIMAQIQDPHESLLKEALIHLPKVLPDLLFFTEAKERITTVPQAIPLWFSFQKGAFAGALAGVLLFVVTFGFGFGESEAAFEPHVSVIAGTVEIKHLGEDWSSFFGNEKIKIGDLLRTDTTGEAEIAFSDFSVTRLAPHTTLTITDLQQTDEQEYVKLSLSTGKIWSQVIDSMTAKGPSLTISTQDSVVEAVNAAFLVSTAENSTTVASMNHAVDVKILAGTNEVTGTTRISAGYQTMISGSSDTVKTASLEPLPDTERTDPWVQKNQSLDREYREQIVAKITDRLRKKAGIISDSPLYPAKQLMQSATTAFTNEKQDAFDIAQDQFLEGVSLLSNGKEKIGQARVQKGIESLLLLKKKPQFTAKVNLFFTEMQVSMQPVLPNSSLYFVKSTLRSLEPKTEVVAQQQALDILSETQDLIAMNESGLAHEHLLTWSATNLTGSGEMIRNDSKEAQTTLAMLHDILFTAQDSALIAEAQQLNGVIEQAEKEAAESKAVASLPQPEKTAEKQLQINEKIASILKNIAVYQSERGQQNQTALELAAIPVAQSSMPLLLELSKRVPETARFVVLKKILEVEQLKNNQ